MKKWILIIALWTSNFAFASGSSSGTRGGGNMEVAAFYKTGDAVLAALLPLSPVAVASQKLNIPALQNIFKNTKLFARSKTLHLNGAVVDAINDPVNNTIEFSQKRWKELDNEYRVQLVIHEILGLARIPDVGYLVSLGAIQVIGTGTDFNAGGLSSDNICEETRSLTGFKAKSFFRSLLVAGFSSTGDIKKSLKIPQLSCRILSDDSIADDQPSVSCNPVATSLAQAQIVVEALEYIGVWPDSGMSHMMYDAQDISCEINSDLQSYKCQIHAYWNWGCPVHPN